MTPLKCLALDDEPLALGLLAEYIKKTPFLELVASCDNAIEALNTIHAEDIDLIFSDIQMNDLSGLELARVIAGLEAGKRPLLIFTTAYEKYALQGYKVDAIDYLLKPFGYEEFLKAASKAKTMRSGMAPLNVQQEKVKEDYILFKVEYQYVKVNLNDIMYIEGLKDYVKVHISGDPKPLLSLTTLKSLEDRLPEDRFMRVHRSYLVSLDNIRTISRTSITIAGDEIPVSENNRDRLQSYFKNRIN